MTRFSFVTLLATAASITFASPVAAQHAGHMPGMNMPGMTMPMPAPKKTATKKVAAKKPTAKKSTARKTSAKKTSPTKAAPAKSPLKKPATGKAKTKPTSDPHAAHDMSSMPGMDMSGAQSTTGSTSGAMPGMDMSTTPAGSESTQDPHAGHDMANMPGMAMPSMTDKPAGTDLPAGTAPPPPAPTDRAADAIYGAQAMSMGRHHLMQFHGDQKFFQALLNVAEVQIKKGRESFEWDGEAWYGGDINRLWLKSSGEGEFGRSVEKAEIQALYSRAVGPYFNLQGGLRYDLKPNPSRAYATVGVEGLAPSFFDLEAALFLSNKGELMARAEGSYDQRITQRLILQPRAEFNFAAQNSPEIDVGAGLSDAEVGLRLRYDIRREFSPYVGVQYRRAFGRTRDYLRARGEDAGSWSLLTGVRMWF